MTEDDDAVQEGRWINILLDGRLTTKRLLCCLITNFSHKTVSLAAYAQKLARVP